MSSSQPLTDPTNDADRIRMKRLAKLQASSTSAPSVPQNPSSSVQPPVQPPVQSPAPSPKPKPPPSHASEPAAAPAPPTHVPPKKKAPIASPFNYDVWENETISQVFLVTLDPAEAMKNEFEYVWLKSAVESELSDGIPGTRLYEALIPYACLLPRIGFLRLTPDNLESVIITRLELDPGSTAYDDEYRLFLSKVPTDQSVFEYLVGCWKRLNAAKSALLKMVSYIGINLQAPDAFYAPNGKNVGPQELVNVLLSLSTLSTGMYGGSTPSPNSLADYEIPPFLQDIVDRFDPEGGLADVLGPVVNKLLFHPSLFREEGLAASDPQWRGVLTGLQALVTHKQIAIMIIKLDEWSPADATAVTLETRSLMGPLLRLNVFSREWPYIAKTYFSNVETRPAVDVESSRNSLRGTLKILQIFNSIVRASPESREAVLAYFARVISLNLKRTGLRVDPATVASDSFMTNIHLVLLHFAEPFMDAQYTKIDRIDPHYYAHTSRIDIKEETRINATSDEAAQWNHAHRLAPGAPPLNFISDIFYLALATGHYGLQKTIHTFDDLSKEHDEVERQLENITADNTWRGTPMQARVEAAYKTDEDKIQAAQMAGVTQLYDPEFLFRSNTFTSFVTVWLIRYADPRKSHPKPIVELPLPKDVPLDFRVLPEYILEDIIDYLFFAVRHGPSSLELSGKEEVLIFTLTFMLSTWWIKNPFLKNKLIDVCQFRVGPWSRGQPSLLGLMLNSHPVALKHLMPALTHFYIEVEQTGASSQFYDKFSKLLAGRSIAFVLKTVWGNPTHREALKKETQNIDKFVRFVNLMMNDVTYLMDESLSELAQIYNIQQEMANREAWGALSLQQRREREGTLHSLERQATSYTQLGNSTVDMLKIFTAETKEPFMMPEIIDRLAAMLDYNLDALVGPRCNDLRVENREKYHFNPRQLLSDVVQVYLNLVAGDGRSYKKELFEHAATICSRNNLKSPTEVEQLRAFVVEVEEAKVTLEAEEDVGDIPRRVPRPVLIYISSLHLDPLMCTIMRDPVILPTSRTVIDRSTIKSHLLSDAKDPFNRAPLSIEEVIPNPELKEQIEAFLAERRNRKAAAQRARRGSR
ncbi:ubiquitin elongating factor core-domain-containing protein [Russula earlei]|uniref:Ubiquitin elongating factor core-domain-containing protein n=1 Tax=Russula earlei TaxID=71964 RepID=A0ACC0U3W5_9AGAM|nr:ubiquitin elongating factor core-domain-containing protein [Russula earlei]